MPSELYNDLNGINGFNGLDGLNEQWAIIYVMIVVFLFLILLLVAKAILLFPKNTRKNSILKYAYNGIQLQGSKEFQTEHFDVLSSERSLFAVIVSGNIDTKPGISIAKLAVETLKNEYSHEPYNPENMEEFFTKAIKKAHKAVSDNGFEHNTPPSIIVVVIENKFLNIAETHGSLRSNSVYLFRGKRLIEVTNRKTISSIQVSRIKLTGDEIIMMASKGVTTSLDEADIIRCLSGVAHPRWRCQRTETIIKQKYLKEQDNVTVVIMEQMP